MCAGEWWKPGDGGAADDDGVYPLLVGDDM